MSGYSGTPLPQKLGIKDGHRVAVVGLRGPLITFLPTVPFVTRLKGPPFDVIVAFVTDKKALLERVRDARAFMTPACGLWIAWPKKSSGVATDVTEDVIRAVALPTGLVDNKVCAIDETWSGLRLVIRKELRART